MPEGEVITAGLGLALGAGMPGEGEGEALSKGLLRQRALPVPVVDMLPVPLFLNNGYFLSTKRGLGYWHDVSQDEMNQTSAHDLQSQRKKGRKQQFQNAD